MSNLRVAQWATGSSPGFITEAVPIVLTSIQRRLDRLTIDEFADLSRRDSPDLLFTIMGFGRPPEAFGEARLQHGRTSFGPSLRALADALGMPLDDIEAGGEVAVASRRALPRLHRPPGRERSPLRVRGRAGHPHHRRPPAGPRSTGLTTVRSCPCGHKLDRVATCLPPPRTSPTRSPYAI